MVKIMKVLKTLRNHWKKSTFATVLGYYGINYAINWHKSYLMMREYSAEALKHGQRPLPGGAKNKHITLFLNPTAGNRKSKSKLEKFSEPLLHLSGFLVNIVKTERIDEARDLAGVIEKTNIIAVAGGDGAIFETITGLLRREDVKEAVMRFPIGIIPLGCQNQFAKRVMKYDSSYSDPQFIAESTMAIVRHKMKAHDVMEITIAEEQNEGEDEKRALKPFYSLAGISIGQYREAQKLKEDMPSLFPNYFSTFWSLLRTPEKLFKAEIRYIPTCSGCDRCLEQKSVQATAQPLLVTEKESRESQPSIWAKIFSIFQPVHAQAMDKEDDKVEDAVKGFENAECGEWSSLCVETSELNIRACGEGRLEMEIGKRWGRTDFMIEGLKRYGREGRNYSQLIQCTDIEILPIQGQDFLSIDNEEFDMKRISVHCLRDKVYFFSP